MARHSANSLKNKIWLATSALAFFICLFGIGSYLVVTLFSEGPFYSVLIRFLFMALAIMVFGWWLANEVVSPIEKVLLLAKSLERGVSVSLPKTTGSIETDELLQTLHRNNQQSHTLVGLMDEVASGNLDVALAPLQTSDRLSNSFQKLLAKVTESIHAKRDLEKLEAAVNQITEEISRVRHGNLDVEIKSEMIHTKEISETLKFLIYRLNELVGHVKGDAKQAQFSAGEMRKMIFTVIEQDESRVRELNQAKLALRGIPQSVQKISEELTSAVSAARQSIETVRHGSQTSQANLSAVGGLRRQMQEAVKRIGKLNERSLEIGKVAKTVEDLAQRLNMISLNAAIQADEAGEHNRGFTIFAEEVERLAARAANTNKQISALNKSMAAEIGETERSLQENVGEAANLSKFAIETGSSLGELEKYLYQFLNLQEKLVAYSGEQLVDTDDAFHSFIASITETENAVKDLKESEAHIALISNSMENLHRAVANFKVSPLVAEESQPANEFSETAQREFHINS